MTACAKSQPVVVTGRALTAPNLFSLAFDNFEGGRLATRHLIELGHRHIAFIAGDHDHVVSWPALRMKMQFWTSSVSLSCSPAASP